MHSAKRFYDMQMEAVFIVIHFFSLTCNYCSQKSSETVLLNLKEICENPPSLNVSAASEILNSADAQSSFNDMMPMRQDKDSAAESIDWDISVDTAQIDWDIGTVEETEDAGNGLGPYEIVNASDYIQSSSTNEAVETEQTQSKKQEDTLLPDVSASEICWDISVETPQVDVNDEVNLPNVGLESQAFVPDTLTQIPGIKEDRSQLLETEYRNKILDDLYEVYSYDVITSCELSSNNCNLSLHFSF